MFRKILLLTLLCSPVLAQQPRQITTTGVAMIKASPSIAQVQGGAMTQGKTAKEALEANAKIMNAIFKGLKEAGLDEKDISTTQVSLRPVIEYSRNAPKVTGYEATNMLAIRVGDLAKLGDVLDKLIQGGANLISEVQLIVPENKERQEEARKQAVLHSRKNAELLVQTAGSKIGRVITIQETNEGTIQPRMRAMAADSMSKSSAPPIATGEQTQEVSVRITWEIVD